MRIEIITQPLQFNLYGFGGTARNKDYAATAFKLSAKMWEIIKAHNMSNKGMNIWVYDVADSVFTGVELEHPTNNNYGLEQKTIALKKYAYYKHIGPYHLIQGITTNMRNELTRQGLQATFPYIEIYGHWKGDESKSETELILCLQ